MILVFLLGATNAGKSTFLQTAAPLYDEIGTVEVGKMMRAKYPPEYFKGSAAPEHTEAEAWQMMLDGIDVAKQAGKKLVLIDGQPRTLKQARKALGEFIRPYFLHFWCAPEVRENRARERDRDDPAKLELSLQRMRNDPIQLYEVLGFLYNNRAQVVVVDSFGLVEDYSQKSKRIIGSIMAHAAYGNLGDRVL